MAKQNEINIDIDALIEDITQIEEISDRVRIAGFGLASPLLKMREAQMKREVKRVAAKKGADHPEVKARMASLQRTEARRVQFDEELSRARIDPVKISRDKDAGIYGRVAENGKPLANMTVIATANKERADFTCTKENGAFALEVPAETEVVVSVRTDEGTEVYRDPEGAVLQPGEQRFKEIDLGRAPQEPCADPFEERPEEETLIMVNLIGQPEADAVGIIKTQGLTLGKVSTRAVEEGVGLVLDQDPEAGTVVQRGDVVSIVVGRSNLVAVPDLTGLTQEEAGKKLEERNLSLGDVEIVSVKAELAGLVVDQDPQPGSQVSRGDAVAVKVGDESEVTVPILIGRTEKDGRAVLEEVGLQLGEVKTTPVAPEKVNIIVDQEPEAGSRVPLGDLVSITVGRTDDVVVPNIIDRTEDEAAEILAGSDLVVGQRSTTPVGEEKVNLITSQNPEAGSVALRGSAVNIVVGRPDEVTVPNLIGRTKDEAAQFIERVGLALGEITTVTVSSPDREGRVQSQDPESGKVVPRDTAVAFSIGEFIEVEVPEVVGLRLDEAQAKIQEAGFRVGRITQVPVDRNRVGMVLSQSPEGGAPASAGAAVNMEVGRLQVFEFKEVVAQAEEMMLEQGVISNAEPGFLGRGFRDAEVRTIAELQEFLALDPREIRDKLGFRNLNITRSMIAAFREIFASD